MAGLIAGVKLRAGEAVYVAEDGKLYPRGVRPGQQRCDLCNSIYDPEPGSPADDIVEVCGDCFGRVSGGLEAWNRHVAEVAYSMFMASEGD